MSKELILPSEVKKHKDFNYTWELDDCEIEDKIKELRKEIYKLQNSRKKQPLLICFRDRLMSKDIDRVRCDIFYGFKYGGKEGFHTADHWRPVTKEQADIIKAKYELTDRAIQIIDRTLKENNTHS